MANVHVAPLALYARAARVALATPLAFGTNAALAAPSATLPAPACLLPHVVILLPFWLVGLNSVILAHILSSWRPLLLPGLHFVLLASMFAS